MFPVGLAPPAGDGKMAGKRSPKVMTSLGGSRQESGLLKKRGVIIFRACGPQRNMDCLFILHSMSAVYKYDLRASVEHS